MCGVHAVNELITEGYFDTLNPDVQLTIILGNPLGFIKKKRFIDTNLVRFATYLIITLLTFQQNRALLPHMFEIGGYETFRARDLSEAILQCDRFLDIHSSSASSPSMMLPAANEESVRFAATFPVDYVVTNLVHATQTRGTGMDWAFYHHKTAVSMECGQHNERVSVIVARNAIMHFVSMADPSYKHNNPVPKILKCLSSEKVRKGFRYLVDVKPFDPIKYPV